MKTYNFSGPLADEMAHFVKLKQLFSGSRYRSQTVLLLQFDRYLVSCLYKDKILTSSIFQSYFNTIKYLSKRSISNHYSVLRHFSIWLNNNKEQSHILGKCPFRAHSSSKTAYIFSIDEIKTILKNSSNLNKRKELIPGLYQTLFTLLYSIGIRIGEALNLNYADYIQDEKIIHIKEGKFRKERYLVLSKSSAVQLNKYLNNYSLILPLEPEEPLFVNILKKRLTHENVSYAFRNILNKSGIKKGPGLHDFRHTFAVHRLIQWYKTEKDINVKLPFLSTFLGHVSITSTQVYLQMTNELMRSGSERFHQFFINHGGIS